MKKVYLPFNDTSETDVFIVLEERHHDEILDFVIACTKSEIFQNGKVVALKELDGPRKIDSQFYELFEDEDAPRFLTEADGEEVWLSSQTLFIKTDDGKRFEFQLVFDEDGQRDTCSTANTWNWTLDDIAELLSQIGGPVFKVVQADNKTLEIALAEGMTREKLVKLTNLRGNGMPSYWQMMSMLGHRSGFKISQSPGLTEAPMIELKNGKAYYDGDYMIRGFETALSDNRRSYLLNGFDANQWEPLENATSVADFVRIDEMGFDERTEDRLRQLEQAKKIEWLVNCQLAWLHYQMGGQVAVILARIGPDWKDVYFALPK